MNLLFSSLLYFLYVIMTWYITLFLLRYYVPYHNQKQSYQKSTIKLAKFKSLYAYSIDSNLMQAFIVVI